MGNYLPSRKQEDDSLDKLKLGQLERFAESRTRTNYLEYYRLYRHRLPYIIEDYLGINMNYYSSQQVPNNLIVRVTTLITLKTITERKMMKDNNMEDLKKLIYRG